MSNKLFTTETSKVKKSALILRAINHKLRHQILKVIDNRLSITVTEIYVFLRIEQSVCSQHLSILRKAGFLTTKRDGKHINYSINKNQFEKVEKIVNELSNL